MTQLAASSFLSIQTLMDRLAVFKHNPSMTQRIIFDALDEITDGNALVLDPTNPFVFLMEASTVNTASAVNESTSLFTKMYASLSQTEEDVYNHMSDIDYLGRFANPSSTKFKVVMQVNDVLNKMVWSPADNAYKATFPRDTVFRVDNLAFTLLYPIDIRRYENGVVQVTYDASIDSPIGDLSSNQIVYTVRRDLSLVDWITFELDVKQFSIASFNYPLQLGQVFSQDIPFTDSFFFARAFYRNNASNGLWVEMQTTHSDQVYDLKKPTAVLKVFDSYVNVGIPLVYTMNGMISGEIRLDIYNTKGSLSVDLSNYKESSFSIELRAIDEQRDLNVHTAALSNISYYGYSAEMVSGGSSAITYDKLRDRTITNSNGANNIPVTPNQIQTKVEIAGFDLVKNIDMVTNRIFLGTQKLPKPTNQKLATSANIGIASFISSVSDLIALDTVVSNDDRTTVLSKNLFKNENGVVRILSSSEIAAIKGLSKTNLVAEVNDNNYLFNPFYYVLDNTSNEFSLRSYNLDYPEASELSFESQNQSLQLPVNTSTYSFTKTTKGYRLSILTASGNFYKDLPDSTVFAQLAYYPVGEARMAYINGVMGAKDADNNRTWTFDLETNYDIDESHNLCITNGRMFTAETLKTYINLEQQFTIFHATSSTVAEFKPDAADALLGKFILPVGAVADTMETLNLKTGSSLSTLWSRSRSFASGQDYKRYDVDVPLYYETDIYQTNPSDGSMVFFDNDGNVEYKLLNKAGDPVLGTDGKQVYSHRRGDVTLDIHGDPILVSDIMIRKEMDFLFIDGRQYFVDDPAFVSYNAELIKVLDTWITVDLESIQEVLLEQSFIYFFPKTNLGEVKVFTTDQGQDTISSEQTLTVGLYVSEDVFKDDAVRSELEKNTVKLLDQAIAGTEVNFTETKQLMKDLYGSSVKALTLSGLGGSKDYQYLRVSDEQNRLCLKKILSLELDGSLIIKEAVDVKFFRVS